jgi:two-component system chemotaxis response regulator CheY
MLFICVIFSLLFKKVAILNDKTNPSPGTFRAFPAARARELALRLIARIFFEEGKAILKKVLITDDSIMIREALKTILVKNNYQIIGEAVNGIEAINKYRELKPDIVTMDINMPEMDGITALKKIRELDPDCKIVVISTLGQESYVREAILSGAKGFIVKPPQEDIIIKTLNKIQ